MEYKCSPGIIRQSDGEAVSSAKIMDFDSICKNAKKLIQYGISWVEGGHEDFYLYDVTLTATLATEKDDLNSAIMIPVWVFSYRDQYGYETDSGMPEGFALSAIDGSRVDLFREVENHKRTVLQTMSGWLHHKVMLLTRTKLL